MPQTTRRPEDILVEYGFHPGTGDAQCEDFTRACSEGLDEVVGAWLDLGMPQSGMTGTRTAAPALIAAAEGGHVSTLGLLLARGADIEARDGSDDTALRTALNWDHLEAVRFLASKGADVDAVSRHGVSALDHAIREGKEANCRLLLELGANPSFTSARRSPMATAITKGASFVALLLDAGAPPSLVLDEDGETALHRAVKKNPEVVAMLLERGASADARDAYGLTPLDYALLVGSDDLTAVFATHGHVPAEQQKARARMWSLLKRNELDEALAQMEDTDVSIEARNEAHETVLMAFAAAGHVAGVRRLLERGANPNAGTQTRCPVESAVDNGHDEVLAVLLDAKASPVDRTGEPAGIHGAIWSGHLDAARRLLGACSIEQRARVAEHVGAAVMKSNVPMLRLLIEMGVPVDQADEIGGETPLFAAAKSWHDHEAVLALLEGGADISAEDNCKRTVLHALVGYHGYSESYEPTLRALLERNARLDALDWLGSTPLETADDEAKAALVRILVTEPLDRGMPVSELAKMHSWATLEAAVHAERSDLALSLIDAGVAVNPPKGVSAETVLHAAVEAQDEELVRGLLARGADPNHAEHYGATPLIRAAGKESSAILTLLLDAGGDPKKTLGGGSHAVHSAVSQPQHLPLLVARGATLDDRVDTPLLWAARQKSVTAATFLLERGALVDVRDAYGRTPLTLAIEKEAYDVAQLLIDAGASPTLMNRQSGDTPLTAAAKKGAADLVMLLLGKGGSLDDKNKEGEDVLSLIMRRKQLRQALAATLAARDIDVSIPKLSPLPSSFTTPEPAWAALYRCDEAAVKRAIEEGALDVNARDPWNVTPLMIAACHRRESLIGWLLEKGADPHAKDSADAMAWDYLGFVRDDAIDALLRAHSKESYVSMDRLNAQAFRSLAEDELHQASTRGEITKIARLIHEKKVHPFVGASRRPLFLRLLGDEDLVTALLELGFSPDVADANGETPLLSALRAEDFALAQRLVDAGARLDTGGLLVTALDLGSEVLTWLLERGADVSVADRDGRLAIHLAAERGDVVVVERLLANDRALLEARDAGGRTPFLVAVANWWTGKDVARHLVEEGADVHASDSEGQTALHLAILAYSPGAARLLLERGASWDTVDPKVPGAVSARALARDRNFEDTWPEGESDDE